MKDRQLSVIVLMIVSVAWSAANSISPQTARHRVFKNTSNNGQYAVTIEGRYYEGFSGPQTVTLTDSKGNVLWGKTFRDNNFQKPIVSNICDVAVPLREGIRFYDSKGHLRATYVSDPGERLLYLTGWEWTPAYSPNGRNYYAPSLAAGERKVVQLIALTDSGEVEWRFDLGTLRPDNIQFSQDRIVVDDFAGAGLHYVNRCYILDRNGKVVSHYDVDLRGIWYRPVLRLDENQLWIFDEKEIRAYSLVDGTFVRVVERGELVDLIYEDNTHDLVFALSILALKTSPVKLPPAHIQRLEHLYTYQPDLNDRYRHYVARFSSMLLTKLEAGKPVSSFILRASLDENQEIQTWISAWREALPDFQFDSLSLASVKELSLRAFGNFMWDKRVQRGWEVRRKMMSYSPDGTMAVDHLSHELYRVNDKWAFAKVPDKTANLYDFTDSTRTLIMSCGTPCGFQIATWVNSTIFIVGGWGTDTDDPELIRPEIHLVDLVAPGRRLFVGPGVDREKAGSVFEAIVRYREEMFPFILWRPSRPERNGNGER